MTRRGLAACAGLSIVVYYVVRGLLGETWVPELVYLVPPGLATGLLWRRGQAATGRTAAFWRLLALGTGLWLVGQVLWTVAVALDLMPRLSPDGMRGLVVPPNAMFIGFLVPMIGAVMLKARPRLPRVDWLAVVDAGLLCVAIGFAFLRFVALPRAVPFSSSAATLAILSLSLAVGAAALARIADDSEWRRSYGLVALFAVCYGLASALANGYGGDMPPPGGPLDLAWIVPFFVLAAAALPGGWPEVPISTFGLLLAAGPGPLVVDLLADLLLPGARDHGAHLVPLLVATAVLCIGCAVRLHLEQLIDARADDESRLRDEESQRSARLGTLAAMSASFIRELQSAMDDVVTRADAVAADLDERGGRVVSQADRARTIARDLATSLRLVRPGARREIDVGRLLEETVEAAVSDGLGLQVSVEGTVGLAPVEADPSALRASFVHLLRNAAQASPGGVLRVEAESARGEVVLRFRDDGPGVPDASRERVFHPFFTTRRVGDGVGLGLTFVHFVARDHGGSVRLEPSETGACFALRLPATERRPEPAGPRWPLAAAGLTLGAMATVLAVLPSQALCAVASASFQLTAAIAAAAAFGWAAARSARRERSFWLMFAVGAALWGLVRLLRPMSDPPYAPPLTGGDLSFFAAAAADLYWVAALLVRPERRPDGSSRRLWLMGSLAVFALAVHLYAYLLVLPAPFAASDPAIAVEIATARLAQRGLLVCWLALLSIRAPSAYWRETYGRLAIGLAVWAVGHSLAGQALGQAGYRPGDVVDLGWVAPFLLLAALVVERPLAPGPAPLEASPSVPDPLRSAVALMALAAVPAFDALFSFSGHAALDLGRERLTRVTVFAVGLLLAVREVLAHREATVTRVLLHGARSQLQSAARRNRVLAVVGSAVHELAGTLSGIRSLLRLLMSHQDLSDRARGDAERAYAATDAAARIVRNLTTLVRRTPDAVTLVSVNDLVRQVVETRRQDLQRESVELRVELAAGLPSLPVDGPALQQVLSGLIDNGAVAIRGAGRRGVVAVSTHAVPEGVVLRVADDGPGLSESVRRRLTEAPDAVDGGPIGTGMGLRMAREIVGLHGGRFSARNQPGGGAEIEIVLPTVSLRPESRDRLTTGA